MTRFLLILLLSLPAAAQIPQRTMSDLLAVASAPKSQELKDRFKLLIGAPTNNTPFAITVGAGASPTTIEWGDGNQATASSGYDVSYTNIYASPGVYSVTIRGGAIRLHFYSAIGRIRILQINSPLWGLTNLVNCQNLFNSVTCTSTVPVKLFECNFSLTNLVSALASPTFSPGEMPDIENLTNLTSIAYLCSGAPFNGNLKTISNCLKLASIDNAFENMNRMTNSTTTVSQIFGSSSRSNLVTAKSAFSVANGSRAWLRGNAVDFIKLEKSPTFVTNTLSSAGSYRMFYFQTNLTDYSTIPADWK